MSNDTHIHIHIHDGASPEAVRAGVDAALGRNAGNDTASAEPDQEVTSQEFLEYVAQAYKDSYASAAKQMLEFLADNPGRMIAYTEISEHLGYKTNRSLPGLLGAFGRRASHRYKGVKPFEEHWIDDAWHLRMTEEAARVINDLR
jgi:predicted restriction endonuclease